MSRSVFISNKAHNSRFKLKKLNLNKLIAMTTPATCRKSSVLLNMPEMLRNEKKHLIPAETWICIFNLQIKKMTLL